MAKKGSKRIMLCGHCLKEFEARELNVVNIEMHKGHPSHGYYGVYICDKCEPKFELDRRQPKQNPYKNI